jgi:glycosyltransferase involved in cell wall biosynthesis
LIWHIITSEYPPQPGGVSDYTKMIAKGLADAGDEVHVWCAATEELPGVATNAAEDRTGDATGVTVHSELGHFRPADLRRVGSLLDGFNAPRRLLVQWVPHGYGYRSMNLPFCLWLRRRSVRHQNVVELMVHEPYLAFAEGSWKQSGVAAVHRLMTMVLLNAARRVWISIPAWEKRLRPYALGRALPFHWLPVPSNIPVVDDRSAVDSVRTKYAPDGHQLVGHFGTYDRSRSELLTQAVPLLLDGNAQCQMLLLGRGSEGMRRELIARHSEFAVRVHAADSLPAAELSLHVSACDLLFQPYIDGVSSRRTSVMVGLAHGVPIVTTSGRLTEPLWAENGAVALAAVGDEAAMVSAAQRLLESADLRNLMSEAARSLYLERFHVDHIIGRLRDAAI